MIPIVRDYIIKNLWVALNDLAIAVALTLIQGPNLGQWMLLTSLGPFAIPLAWKVWPQPLWIWYVLGLAWVSSGMIYFKMPPSFKMVQDAKYPIIGEEPK